MLTLLPKTLFERRQQIEITSDEAMTHEQSNESSELLSKRRIYSGGMTGQRLLISLYSRHIENSLGLVRNSNSNSTL
jgi:hypothetical protein